MAEAAQYNKKSVVHYPSGYLPIAVLALLGIAKIPLFTIAVVIVACILTLIDARFVRVKYRADSAFLILHRYSTAASIAARLARALPLNGKRVRSLSEGGLGYDSGNCIPLRYWSTWAIDFYHFVTYYVVTEEDEAEILAQLGYEREKLPSARVEWSALEADEPAARRSVCASLRVNGYVVLKNAEKFGDLSLKIWDTYDRLFPNPLTAEMITKGVLTFPTAAGPISWGWPLELNRKQIPGAHILDMPLVGTAYESMIPFPEALRALYRPCWLAGREIAVKCATSIIQENGIAEPETLLPRFVDSPNSVTTSMLRLQKNMTKEMPLTAQAHVDGTMLTLLPASAIPGLEVMHIHTGEWVQVERELTPGKDVIAIAGAAMGWLTNGQYRPLIHRVRFENPASDRRFSMPYFMGFQHEISISGQPQFASPQGMVNFPKATGDITKISVLNDDLRTLNFTSRIGYGIGFYLRLGYRYQNAKRRLASLLGREPKKSA